MISELSGETGRVPTLHDRLLAALAAFSDHDASQARQEALAVLETLEGKFRSAARIRRH